MSATTSDVASFRFSTEDLPPADRVPFYQEVIGRMFVKVGIEPTHERFVCDVSFYRLPDLCISDFAGTPVQAIRTREMAEGSEVLLLAICLEGAATISQRGREVAVPTGNSILLSCADPTRMARTTSRFLGVGIPRAVLRPMLTNLDAALMSVIPNNIEAIRLLIGYLNPLIKETPIESAELRHIVVGHVHDLIAMAAGATRDAAEVANGRGLRAARIRAIKADIAQNLDRDVTAAALSSRHRVSARYIRKLFEDENTSLSQFVLGQRLSRVHRMLGDPRYAGVTISGIAFAVGFRDLSTFNRDFRRYFGVTPSDVRAAARDNVE